MRRKIVTVLTNPAFLRKKCISFPDVTEFSDEHRSALQDLNDTFQVLQGYGLALPQIGIARRGLVVNFTALGRSDLGTETVMINPEMICHGDVTRHEEACFSVPHVSAKVDRYSNVTVRYTTLLGECKQVDLEGFAAACLQHEIDHLDGKIYIDKIGSVWRSLLLKKIRKLEKRIKDEESKARKEFEMEHREIMGLPKKEKKTTYSKKRKPKTRKKRPNRSKKK